MSTGSIENAGEGKHRYGGYPCGWYVLAFIGLGILLLFYCMATDHAVTMSTSPDGKFQISVRQPRLVLNVDRNFRVILTDKQTREKRELYRSDDQSPTIRDEYFVWTGDSRSVALVGDRYASRPDAALPGGMIVFLVYDILNNRLYCNTDAEQRGMHPTMTALEAVELFGEGRLEPRESDKRDEVIESVRWLVADALFVLAAFFISAQWGGLADYYRRQRHDPRAKKSVVPFIGGCIGLAGCLIAPSPTMRSLWWLPLLIDPGCTLVLGGSIVRIVRTKAFRHI